MRGYVLDRYGGPTAMTLREVPAPVAGAGSVLIRVHAAGLNPIDYKVRQGKARLLSRPDVPLVVRSELVGVAAATARASPGSPQGSGCSPGWTSPNRGTTRQ